jgi:hypothetical protein
MLTPQTHILFWYGAVALMVVAVGFGFEALQALQRSDPTVRSALARFAVVIAVLVGLLAFWGRYLYFPNQLKALLAQRGGADFEIRQHELKARVGTLWVLAAFDNPLFSYAPWRKALDPEPPDSGGAGRTTPPGHYMLSIARANVFRLGDFSRLSPHTTRVSSGAGAFAPTGLTRLDRALRRASSALAEADVDLRVEVGEQWLRVEVRGGSWLGARFGDRILIALDFTERLIAELRGEMGELNGRDLTVDAEGAGFVVKPIGPYHRQGRVHDAGADRAG